MKEETLKDPNLPNIDKGNIQMSIMNLIIIALVGMIGNEFLMTLLFGILCGLTLTMNFSFITMLFTSEKSLSEDLTSRSSISVLIILGMVIFSSYWAFIGMIPAIVYAIFKIPFLYMTYASQRYRDILYTDRMNMVKKMSGKG